MNHFDVLKRPLLSEKSNKGRENLNKYSFQVAVDATKDDIRKAVEKIYNVKVETVTTLVTRGKVKRRGNTVYQTARHKKAVVTLPEGAKIGLFEDL